MELSIREISSSELHIVSSLSYKIWPISYKEIITQEQIQFMLNWMYSEKSLQENINDGHRFLLAELEGMPVGFVGFQADYPEKNKAKIHKLYVLTDIHNQGIGKKLSERVIVELKKLACNSIELQVNKKNPAVAFYTKMGFTTREEKVFDIGNGFVMDDYVMTLPI